MSLKTQYVFPPIPMRQFDWCAYDDNTYDGPGSVIGWGPTEQEAIAELNELIEDKRCEEEAARKEGALIEASGYPDPVFDRR